MEKCRSRPSKRSTPRPTTCFAGSMRLCPPSTIRLYIEAKERLTELKVTVRLLKTAKIERAIGEIDKYSGTTINDLKDVHEES